MEVLLADKNVLKFGYSPYQGFGGLSRYWSRDAWSALIDNVSVLQRNYLQIDFIIRYSNLYICGLQRSEIQNQANKFTLVVSVGKLYLITQRDPVTRFIAALTLLDPFKALGLKPRIRKQIALLA
jgi:hypothetical protein